MKMMRVRTVSKTPKSAKSTIVCDPNARLLFHNGFYVAEGWLVISNRRTELGTVSAVGQIRESSQSRSLEYRVVKTPKITQPSDMDFTELLAGFAEQAHPFHKSADAAMKEAFPDHNKAKGLEMFAYKLDAAQSFIREIYPPSRFLPQASPMVKRREVSTTIHEPLLREKWSCRKARPVPDSAAKRAKPNRPKPEPLEQKPSGTPREESQQDLLDGLLWMDEDFLQALEQEGAHEMNPARVSPLEHDLGDDLAFPMIEALFGERRNSS